MTKAASLDKLAGELMLVCAVIFAAAGATIVTAHVFETFGGYAACPLCLQERYAYYFALPATLVGFFAARAESIGLARIVLGLIALAFLINAGLGVYHAGIEWKWWEGPSTCAGGTAVEWGESGLAQQLETARVVSCAEAQWRFIGLSFAGWNAVVSVILAGLAVYGAALRRR